MQRFVMGGWPAAAVILATLFAQAASADDVSSLSRASRRGDKALRRDLSTLELREVLQRVGVVLEQTGLEGGAVVKWKLEPRRGRAIATRRILEAGDTIGSQFRAAAYYRGKELAMSGDELSAHAAHVIQALCEALVLPCDEVELVPEAPQYLNHNSSDGRRTETFVVAARVPFRVRIDGVSVYGPGGTGAIMYDADGSLTGVDLPLVSYRKPAVQTRAGTRAPVLEFQGQGLGAAPSHVGQTVEYRGKMRRVTALRCGYYDDGQGEELAAGCTVSISGRGASTALSEPTFFVPVK